MLAAVLDELINGPLAIAESVGGNLGPGVTIVGGDPDLDGTLVANYC